MERHSIVFVTDERQRYLAHWLSGKVRTVTIGEALEKNFCETIIAEAACIILPTPAARMSVYGEGWERICEYWNEGQIVFGGVIGETLRHKLDVKNIRWEDLMEDETVTRRNAEITAEAVVAEVLSRSVYSLAGQKIVITGYGRCARAVAAKLSALGAKITILARSQAARKQACRDGYWAVDFAYGPQEAYGTMTFINTVPACVVTEKILREMHEEALILDIASDPGGCDREAAARCGMEVVMLPGLPGRYTAKSSAKVLSDAIMEKTRTITGRKEEKTWIYQILPSDTA